MVWIRQRCHVAPLNTVPIASTAGVVGLISATTTRLSVSRLSLVSTTAAGVVGLISATTLVLFRQGVSSLPALGIFVLALAAVYLWKVKAAVAGIVLGAGILGLVLTQLLA